MLVDEHPFPMHTIELQGAKVLVWPEQDESTKGAIRCKGTIAKYNLVFSWFIAYSF
jgi:hypothetical protein